MDRPTKRRRTPEETYINNTNSNCDDLQSLLASRRWEAAEERVSAHPEEAQSSTDPSALALACRLGAPYSCVEQLLKVCPRRLRHVLDSRGTPLHEAIVCADVGPRVIELLLRTDEELEPESPRATILQDVDGYTPLHVLIRRRFQSHVLGNDEGADLMEILEMLVKSCPEAVVVPDCGEYEEPPIVMALKANVYAPSLQSEDGTAARIERNIYDMVNCMLHHYPRAASCIFNGYRGQYSALHSAVFHGRCPETIELILKAEERSTSTNNGAALLGNTQGEMPLHFCTMRGEPPRTVALLAAAAPEAVLRRDSSGLTPMHWLWVRFVSVLLALDDGGRGTDATIPLDTAILTSDSSPYDAFSSLFQGNFEADLQFIRRLDPPVDFLRMRHIPVEILQEDEAIQWAERTVRTLQHVRSRYEAAKVESSQRGTNATTLWTRVEAVTCLFWTKVVSLLRAASEVDGSPQSGEFSLVHAAFTAPCSLPPIARIVASLYPEEINKSNSVGRLPLHGAALRAWHAWDWPRDDGTSDSAHALLLRRESALVLKTAMTLSSNEVAHHKDQGGWLPLHYVISTLVRACSMSGRSVFENPLDDILEIINGFVRMNPDSLCELHPTSGLLPFMHASSVVAEYTCLHASGFSAPFSDELPLTIVYSLLRQNPSLIRSRSNPEG